jgi:tetratricopeptide (TPR) repeat protein
MGILDGWKAKRFLQDAETALEHGDFRAAIHALTDTIHLKPNWHHAQYLYGSVLLASADANVARGHSADLRATQSYELATEALKALNRSLRDHPRHPEAHNDRGRALVKLDRLTEADEAFAAALEQRPDFQAASYNRRWLQGQMLRLENLDIEGADHEVMRELRESNLRAG